MATLNERKAAIAHRLKFERKQSKNPKTGKPYSQEEIADLVNSKKSTVINWERDYGNSTIPPMEKLLKLSELFKCDITYLLCEHDYRHSIDIDICKETGLSPEAVSTLRSDVALPANNNYEIKSMYIDVINALLIDGKGLLAYMRDYVNKQYTLAHTKYTADDEYVTPMALDSDGNLLYKEEAVNCYKNIPYILTNNSYFRKEYESSYTNAEVDDVKFSAFETAMEHKCHNIGFSPDDICNLINYASEVIAAENIKFASIGELMRLLDKTAEKGFAAQDTSSK